MNRPTQSAELLAEAGKALYTETESKWLEALANDLKIDIRTLRAWLSGKRALQPNNTVMTWAADELEQEARALVALAVKIRQGAANYKPAPIRRPTPVADSRSTSKSAASHSRS